MTGQVRRAAMTLAALGWAGVASAQGEGAAPLGRIEAEMLRCRAVADSLARIVCYDAIVLPLAATARPAATAAPSNAALAASAPAAPTAAAVSTPPTVGNSDLSRDFGLPERAAVQALQFIDSTIQGEFDGWAPQARLQLANGQVWEIADGSVGTYALVRNPKVRISRGMLGSFFLSIEGVAQVPRVRRVR